MSAGTAVRFNPFSAGFRDDPYPLYERLRERPVHKTLGMWVVSRHADVRAVLQDRTFSSELIPQLVSRQAERVAHEDVERIQRVLRLGRASLVFTDNPGHARLRGLVNRVFTARAVAALRPRAEAIAGRLVERARADGGMDAIEGLAAPLPVEVLSDWMALPGELRNQVGPWTHAIRHLLEPGLLRGAVLARVAGVVEEFAHALREVVTLRRARPGADLVSRLLAARTARGDRFGDEELAFVCIMCFVAGNETTRSLIGNALLALLRHPEQAQRLRRKPGLAPAAVAEALRYDSPLQLTKRLTTRETEIGGVRVGAGEQVLLCLGSANRDPAVFAGPDVFDLARGARAHLAFGHGMHGCLGGALATMQAESALTCLYQRTEHVEREGDALAWQDHSFIIRGLKHLPVSLRGAR